MLLYKAEEKGRSLLVRLQEEGSKRILYLDTLKALAKESDKEALSFLVKIHLKTTRNPDTLDFRQIEVPPSQVQEALRLMAKTGRLIKKEIPPELPLEVKPLLKLKDASGSFANLWMDYGIELIPFEDFSPTIQGRPRLKKEEIQWEKDLLESGYSKKIVGDSYYYCPSEKVKESLQLLLDVGWHVKDATGKEVGKALEISEENGKIIIRGQIRGMIDPKIQMVGVWEGEVFTLKKNHLASVLPLLESSHIHWEERLRTLAEGLKEGASLEPSPPGPCFKGKLLPYQQKGVDWLSFLYRWGFSALLADEMGLGKTVQVLAFLSRLRTNLPILIVAPTSLLFNWRDEIARFLPESNIVLTSYAQLRLNEEGREFEVIVLDESNAIKTASTQTARAACRLKGRFKICLSGTPMENRPEELASQFQFLMPDLIGKSDLKQKCRPFLLRRKKEEVQIDLPEKMEQIAWVEMDEDQKALYEMTRKGFKKEGASRMQILETILRLRQICCDPRLVGSEVGGSKLPLFISDVLDALEEKRKVLIYSQFTSMLQLIHKEFPQALYLDGTMSGEKRGELVHRFQEDEQCSLFLLSLKAGGVGLNLTAADTVFLFDPWWNEAVERQAIDRAHRIGQKKTVLAKRYLTIGSIEEKMLQLKNKKQQIADQLLDFEGGNWTEEDLLLLLS